ncbi:DNA replication and repair protein RecF [Deinococcus sp.]|uniref:DNA replication/repair protein RecF n=1 Tax=Deinococcus sp. TaxID=47478 RepID=UPI0025B7C0E9|nr:DNA replication and repair protein RecF [Deinococcus sp.]
MRLDSLSTLNYRNLAPCTLAFPAGVTGVFGENGAGKTNLLEAAYLALTGLTDVSRLEQLVQQGETEAYVRADLESGGSLSVQEVGLGRGRRQLKLDGVRVRTGDLPRGSAVWIRPEDSEMVFGSPSGRRAFLDSLLSRLSARYAEQLARYERTVSQRNAALRGGEEWAMHVWDESLVRLGTEIMLFRRRALVRLNELAAEANAALGSRKTLTLSLTESTTPESYAQDMGARRAEELARGSTATGPHRDDLLLTLGDFPASEYASRGEGRTVALALRRAELELLAERFGERPVLLVDDFSAELDPVRRSFLLELAASVPQAIVTGTERAPGAALTLRAQSGRFTPEAGPEAAETHQPEPGPRAAGPESELADLPDVAGVGA